MVSKIVQIAAHLREHFGRAQTRAYANGLHLMGTKTAGYWPCRLTIGSGGGAPLNDPPPPLSPRERSEQKKKWGVLYGDQDGAVSGEHTTRHYYGLTVKFW